jgi:hypothetical protein
LATAAFHPAASFCSWVAVNGRAFAATMILEIIANAQISSHVSQSGTMITLLRKREATHEDLPYKAIGKDKIF